MYTIEAHNLLPIIAVCTTHGFVLLLQFNVTDGLQLLGKYHLSPVQIETICFVNESMTAIAMDVENVLFHIQMHAYDDTDIKGFILSDSSIIDISTIFVNGLFLILTLCNSDSNNFGRIHRIEQDNTITAANNVSLEHYYSSMRFVVPDRLLGVRQVANIQTIDLYEMRIVNDEFELIAHRSIQTPHRCNDIRLAINSHELFSLGDDGKIIEWQMDSLSMVKTTELFDHLSKRNVLNIRCDRR